MSPSLPDFPFERLSVDDRLQLLGRLWDSLLESDNLPATPAWHIRELERRVAEADTHPESAIPLEQLRSELLRDQP
jgi:putative addiction module component (TIGR02574 family)